MDDAQPRLKAVLFDLDRTLLDRDVSIEAFIRGQYERFRGRLEGIAPDVFCSLFVSLDARGALWKDRVYQAMVEDLGLQDVGWEELFHDFLSYIGSHYVPFSGLHEMLAELAPKFRLGLITNGRSDFQRRTIGILGLGRYFATILISEEEGVRKPQPEIFYRALERLGVRPEEAVYVGDHPTTDVLGARAAGLRAIWMRNPDFANADADAVIDRLDELPEVLGRMERL